MNMGDGNMRMRTRGTTVSRRAKIVEQPRGGYIRPRDMELIQLDDGVRLEDNESVPAQVIGLVVEYLSRLEMGCPLWDTFEISMKGGYRSGRQNEVEMMISNISGLDDESILYACRVCAFDTCYRAGVVEPFIEPEDVVLDEATAGNIRIMVERTKTFFEKYGPITAFGFGLQGGFTEKVTSGDGDLLTKDTVWDMKVLRSKVNTQQTLQLAMYYLMGKHSGQKRFNDISRIGIFNPRQNIAYIMDMGKVSDDVIGAIETEVIGYE